MTAQGDFRLDEIERLRRERQSEALPTPDDAELAYRYFPALFGVVISSSATKDEKLREIAEMAKEARWYHERGISPEDALRGGSGDE